MCDAGRVKPVRVRLAPDERRQLIIEAATRQISERGFNTLTMSRLAHECDMTRAGVEHYFSSLPELLIAVLRHRDERDVLVLAPTGALPRDEQGMWGALDALVRHNAARPEIVRLYAILGAEALDPAHPAHEYFLERGRATRAALAEGAKAWHPRPEEFAVEVLARLDGLQLQWLRDPSLDLAHLWESAASVLVRS